MRHAFAVTEDPPRGQGPGGVTFSRPWPFLLLALGFLGVGISFWRPIPAGVWHDDGVYMLIGESLAQGEGLRYLGVPGNPPAVKFPPLHPGVLGLLWVTLGSVGPVTLVAVLLNLVLMATAAGLLGVGLSTWARESGKDPPSPLLPSLPSRRTFGDEP